MSTNVTDQSMIDEAEQRELEALLLPYPDVTSSSTGDLWPSIERFFKLDDSRLKAQSLIESLRSKPTDWRGLHLTAGKCFTCGLQLVSRGNNSAYCPDDQCRGIA